MRLFLTVLLLVSCHKEVKEQVQLDQSEHKAEAADDQREWSERRERAPVDTDTKTTKLDNAVVVQEPDGSIQVAKVTPDKPLRAPKGSHVLGTVPLGSVVTEQDKHVGPVMEAKNGSENKKTSSDDDKKAHLEGTGETDTDTGFGWKFYATVIAVAVAVLAAGLVILKYKLWRPL